MKEFIRQRRLTKAAHVLRNLKKELPKEITFDMGAWYNENDPGTDACALRVLALHPWFRRRGLHIKRLAADFFEPCSFPEYKGECGTSAGELFFGVTGLQAAELFYPGIYPIPFDKITPEHVAQRFDALAARYKADDEERRQRPYSRWETRS